MVDRKEQSDQNLGKEKKIHKGQEKKKKNCLYGNAEAVYKKMHKRRTDFILKPSWRKKRKSKTSNIAYENAPARYIHMYVHAH